MTDSYLDHPPDTRATKRRYGAFFTAVSAILFELDPIGINFETNTDEYDPEAGTIIPRLQECASVSDVERIAHEEFVQWFGEEIAGPRSRYQKPAEKIWDLWNKQD